VNAMSDREICGVCQGTWPCSCSASAVPVVMMSADDNLAASLARRMGSERNDPLTIVPIEPESPLAVYDYGRGEDFDKFCGHRSCQYDVDMDKREECVGNAERLSTRSLSSRSSVTSYAASRCGSRPPKS